MHVEGYIRADSRISTWYTGTECESSRKTETGIVLGRNICVPEIDEHKNRERVSRCFMHPAQREGDRAPVVYAVVGERWKRINIRRYARTGVYTCLRKTKSAVLAGAILNSLALAVALLSRWAEEPGFTELENSRAFAQ